MSDHNTPVLLFHYVRWLHDRLDNEHSTARELENALGEELHKLRTIVKLHSDPDPHRLRLFLQDMCRGMPDVYQPDID
ncbi:MAG: hypothetical protein AAF197_12925 [Pseudomonadota bacterium]